MSEPRWWQLVWSDYEAHYRYKAEPAWRARLLAAPRLLSNASLHANILVRLMLGGPTRSAWLFRRLLILAHGCDIALGATIGPGLQMSHPLGITIGPRVAIGREVALFHGTTLRAGQSGWLQVDDGVQIFTGAFVSGSITLGRNSTVGANATLDRDLDPGTAFTRAHFSGSRA